MKGVWLTFRQQPAPHAWHAQSFSMRVSCSVEREWVCKHALCQSLYIQLSHPIQLHWLVRVPTYMLLLHICAAAPLSLTMLGGLGRRPSRFTQHLTHTCYHPHVLLLLSPATFQRWFPPGIRKAGSSANPEPHVILLRPLSSALPESPAVVLPPASTRYDAQRE